MTSDIIGLLASYLYAGGLLIIAEVLHRRCAIPSDITRKFVHVMAGMWIFGVLALFRSWQIGVIPFATFIGLNYFFYRVRLFKGIDSPDASLGTVYYAISITALSIALWRPQGPIDHMPAVVAGVMAMTWGDASAALIGKRYGTRRYTINGSTRSYEGSAVMFVVTAVVVALTLTLLPGSGFAPYAELNSPLTIAVASLAGAAVGTVVEALSPHGTDNLSVPICVALVALIAG
jgi:phytol kinase